jgi:asparagine N-glycosylation enzyme membrane subunit Stt3
LARFVLYLRAKEGPMSLGTLLLILLVLALIGAFPAWPYSSGWGYYPSGGLGVLLLVVVVLVVAGRI